MLIEETVELDFFRGEGEGKGRGGGGKGGDLLTRKHKNKNANLKHFFLRDFRNRDVFNC